MFLFHIQAWEVILAIGLFFTIVEVITAALLIYGTIKVWCLSLLVMKFVYISLITHYSLQKCHYSLLPWLITFGCVVFFTLLRSFIYTIVFFVTLFSGDIHMLLMSAFTWILIVLTTGKINNMLCYYYCFGSCVCFAFHSSILLRLDRYEIALPKHQNGKRLSKLW